MTIIKLGNGILLRERIILIQFGSSSYIRSYNDDKTLKGVEYSKLGAGVDIINRYLKR